MGGTCRRVPGGETLQPVKIFPSALKDKPENLVIRPPEREADEEEGTR